LEQFLTQLGFDPEIKILNTTQTSTKYFNQDLVNSEIVIATDPVVGRPDLHTKFAQEASKSIPQKALYSIFEQRNPRGRNIKADTEDVFNIKWDRGGLNDFLILRTIAKSYGSQQLETVACLKDLLNLGKITDSEFETLTDIFAQYLFFRNETHVFAGQEAERLGPKTRRHICDTLPSPGNPEEFKAHLKNLARYTHQTFLRVRDAFLKSQGINPEEWEKFDQLPIDAQLTYAKSTNPNCVSVAAWGTTDPKVLDVALENQPSYLVLQAVSRSRYVTPETLRKVEVICRNNPNFGFSRLMLAVQTNADPELLTLLFRNTTPDSTQSEKIRAIAKKRLAHFHYDTEYEIKDELKKELECIVFYPESFHDYFLKNTEETLTPHPGRLYINYAGRLAVGKNFEAFLRLAAGLKERGIDFESHVFGPLEPSFSSHLELFWELFGHDQDLVKRIKYHGEYDLASLKKSVLQMQTLGTSVFVFSKGLTTKELLSMGQSVITTDKGNGDVSQLKVACLDEDQLQDPRYLEQLISNILQLCNSPENLKLQGLEAQAYVNDNYGLEKWGKCYKQLLKGIKPDFRSVLILGTGPLTAPHGPAVWSRNLLKYAQNDSEIDADYVTLPNSSSVIFNREAEIDCSKDESMAVCHSLEETIKTVLSVNPDCRPTNQTVDQFVSNLTELSKNPNAVAILSSKVAEKTTQSAFEHCGITQDQILYPVIACDEVTSYGRPVRPMFKLVHLIESLQKELPESDVNISFGKPHVLVAVKEKVQRGTPFIYVDHVLASDEPLLQSILDSEYYSQQEKSWFQRLHALIKSTIRRYADKYVALWEINQNIAIKQLGIDPEKITLIPNGVDTTLIKT